MSAQADIAATGVSLRSASDSRFWSFIRLLLKQRGALPALVIILAISALAIFAPLVAPYPPNDTELSVASKAPSLAHPFGTDQLGRDALTRIIYGARVSMSAGIVAVGLAMVVGVPLGLIAGYFGSFVDSVIMRILDAVLAIPQLVSALAIVATFGAGFFQVMIAIGVGTIPVYARITRGQVLSEREQDYVLAAASMGADSRRILVRHILPNILSPLIVQGSLGVAFAILAEASLSFLGVGIKPPDPTWGGMLSDGLTLINRAPWLSIFPGIAIFITVLSINTVGDTLRDILDPRLRGSR